MRSSKTFRSNSPRFGDPPTNTRNVLALLQPRNGELHTLLGKSVKCNKGKGSVAEALILWPASRHGSGTSETRWNFEPIIVNMLSQYKNSLVDYRTEKFTVFKNDPGS